MISLPTCIVFAKLLKLFQTQNQEKLLAHLLNNLALLSHWPEKKVSLVSGRVI